MRFGPDLGRCLSEMHNLGFFADSCLLIRDVFQFNGVLVGKVIVQI